MTFDLCASICMANKSMNVFAVKTFAASNTHSIRIFESSSNSYVNARKSLFEQMEQTLS